MKTKRKRIPEKKTINVKKKQNSKNRRRKNSQFQKPNSTVKMEKCSNIRDEIILKKNFSAEQKP